MKKQNTDIGNFEVKKIPAVKPEETFQDSRFMKLGRIVRWKSKLRKKQIQSSKQRMADRIVKEFEK